MKFSQLSWNNITRNRNLYLGYFFSNMFIVMMFFTFLTFAFNPVLSKVHLMAVVGMSNAAIVILIFSIFYVHVSMSSFLHMRKKEFGILMIQGLSPRQLLQMIISENVIISFISATVGMLAAIPFIYLISVLGSKLFPFTLTLYFPIKAIIFTLVLFISLFILLSFFVFRNIRKENTLILLTSETAGKVPPKAATWKTILSIILILTGYTIALLSKDALVVYALLPVMLLVIIGTKLFFSQSLIFFSNKLKSNPKIFWKKTNMLFLSDMSFRMQDNARSFFFITIISTVVFSAMGTLFSFQEFFTKTIDETYQYIQVDYTTNSTHSNALWDEIVSQVQTADSNSQHAQFSLIQDIENDVLYINLSTYNNAASEAEKIETLGDHAAVLVKSKQKKEAKLPDQSNTFAGYQEVLNFELVQTIYTNVIPYTSTYVVITDNEYQSLQQTFTDYNIIGGIKTNLPNEQQIILGNQLMTLIDEDSYFISTALTKHEVFIFYAPILFIGLFISVIFFISSGSFLYFRMFNDLEEDEKKFRAISRIGLTKKELRLVVTKQLLVLFGIPWIFALLHGTVALQAMSNLFAMPFTISSAYVLLVFTLIQFVYFIIARITYLRKIEARVFTT